jgi:hypothetical protein
MTCGSPDRPEPLPAQNLDSGRRLARLPRHVPRVGVQATEADTDDVAVWITDLGQK